ncbi:MAG: transcription antitermination factor NusB [Polyangia bacterium]
MATRRRAREVVLQMLFQLEASGVTPEQALASYRECFGEGPLPDEFGVRLFRDVVARRDEIDRIIVEASANWRLERMSGVDRNILRIGAHELGEGSGVPTRVAINEAVELAKRYGSSDSAAFVNGILDRIAHDESRL